MALREREEIHLLGGDKERLPVRLLRQSLFGVLERVASIAQIVRQPAGIRQKVRGVLAVQRDPDRPILKRVGNALLEIGELRGVSVSHQEQKPHFIPVRVLC